jgi:hypothetical protein
MDSWQISKLLAILFLLIDFAEEDPMIYVRAWQPETWSDDELIKTANFRIYK